MHSTKDERGFSLMDVICTWERNHLTIDYISEKQ